MAQGFNLDLHCPPEIFLDPKITLSLSIQIANEMIRKDSTREKMHAQK